MAVVCFLGYKGYDFGIFIALEDEVDGLFTIFVDNLPNPMDVGWHHQLFSPFRNVMDVYMSSKRNASLNIKYGFLRFKKREETLYAIEDLNVSMIRSVRIVV